MTYNGFETLPEALNAHREWVRGENSGKRLDLRGADLRDVDLNGANLSGAKLNGAKLNGANLKSANLRGADLRAVNLSSANLSGANLDGANLNSVNLRCANLNYANLSGAKLNGAELDGAELNGAKLNGASLRKNLKWERYLSELVPALLTAGGKTLEEVSVSWDCHSWENCPMAVAFGVHTIDDIPPLYQREAELFVTLFDAKQIPNPLAAT